MSSPSAFVTAMPWYPYASLRRSRTPPRNSSFSRLRQAVMPASAASGALGPAASVIGVTPTIPVELLLLAPTLMSVTSSSTWPSACARRSSTESSAGRLLAGLAPIPDVSGSFGLLLDGSPGGSFEASRTIPRGSSTLALVCLASLESSPRSLFTVFVTFSEGPDFNPVTPSDVAGRAPLAGSPMLAGSEPLADTSVGPLLSLSLASAPGLSSRSRSSSSRMRRLQSSVCAALPLLPVLPPPIPMVVHPGQVSVPPYLTTSSFKT